MNHDNVSDPLTRLTLEALTERRERHEQRRARRAAAVAVASPAARAELAQLDLEPEPAAEQINRDGYIDVLAHLLEHFAHNDFTVTEDDFERARELLLEDVSAEHALVIFSVTYIEVYRRVIERLRTQLLPEETTL